MFDQLLFRAHHRAEEQLRRVTAALAYATENRTIMEALVLEPVRCLDLASAAVFYRDTADGPLRRVLAEGWSEEHLTSLPADAILLRYLQAEHGPLRLDEAHWLPTDIPGGAAFPVLAIPVVIQHTLVAVVLYGSHSNSTLPDPDEVALLHSLSKAAATAHQHVQIGLFKREREMQQLRIGQLEVVAAELRALLSQRNRGL